VADKVNALSNYVDNRPGGWNTIQEVMDKAPVMVRKELDNMLNILAARRAVQAAGGSQSGGIMTLIRGVGANPKTVYPLVRTTDRLLKTMTSEEQTAFRQMLPQIYGQMNEK